MIPRSSSRLALHALAVLLVLAASASAQIGPFQVTGTYDSPGGSFNWIGVSGEIDGDGVPEVAYRIGSSGFLVFSVDASGGVPVFTPRAISYGSLSLGTASDAEFVDLDGDGKDDLLVTDENGCHVFEAVQAAGATSSTLTHRATCTVPTGHPTTPNVYEGPAAADFDDDGTMDLVYIGGNELFVLKGNGLSAPTPFVHVAGQVFNAFRVDDLDVGDIDGDGDADIVGCSFGSVRFLENTGDQVAPNFLVPIGIGGGLIGERIQVGTLDDVLGDDIVVFCNSQCCAQPGLGVVRRTIAGTYQVDTYRPNDDLNWGDVGDIDGDGYDDIVGTRTNFTAVVYPGTSTGALGTALPVPEIGMRPLFLDANDDGFLDILGRTPGVGSQVSLALQLPGPQYPGNGDVLLQTSLGSNLPDDNAIKTGNGGSLYNMHVFSPTGSLVGDPLFVGASVNAAGSVPLPVAPVIPNLYLDLNTFVILWSPLGTPGIGSAALGPFGTWLSLEIPPALSGSSVTVQAGIFPASTGLTLTFSNAHVLLIN